MKKFIMEPWRRDGYSCIEEYQWEHDGDRLTFYRFSDIENPSFPKAVNILNWAAANGKLTDKLKERYEATWNEIVSKFNSEEELEQYLEKIHGKK